MELFTKAKSGIKWNSVSQFGRQAIQIISTIIYTRYITPQDFGLMSMAMVIIGFLNVFRDLGTSSAIIQQQEINEELLSSVFWYNIFFGVTVTLIIYLCSSFFSHFYNETRLENIFQILSLTFFISSLGIAHQSILEKSLRFDLLAKLELLATFTGSGVGVVMSINNFGVMSLVFQAIVTTSVSSFFLFTFSQWKPKLIFQVNEVRKISRFSLNLTGYSIFNYAVRNADNLLIGKYLGAQQLGYYNLAYRILLYPIQSITAVISRVMFPVFSKLQDDIVLFRQTYLKMVKTIAFITFPMMLGLMAVSKYFVFSFFGKEWEPVILLLLIFSPIALIQSIDATTGIIFQAMGRSDWLFRWGIATGILALLSFTIGLQWGITGVAISYLFATMIWTYPGFAIPFRLVKLTVKELVSNIRNSIVFSAIMSSIVFASSKIFYLSEFVTINLFFLIVVGSLTYIAINFFYNKEELKTFLMALK